MQNFGIESIFKPTVWNWCIHRDINDKCVKIVNIATSKYLVVESTMFCNETFISTPDYLLIGRITTTLFLYC